MTTTGKTIQIFCPHGEPRGVRIAEMTTRIVQAVVSPRSQLDLALQRAELRGVGVYFLFGQAEETSRPLVYIGEAEDCAERIKQHNQQKEFWNTSIAIVSRTQSFTKAHVRMLEWLSIKKTVEAKRFELDNGNEGSEPRVPEAMAADVYEVFETVDVLLSTLGFPIFEPLVNESRSNSQVRFYCNRGGAKASGLYTEEGFVVEKGSTARSELLGSARDAIRELRDGMIRDGTLVKNNGELRFSRDHVFSSPSTAASVVVGGSSNGWREWKDDKSRTLHDVYRAS